MGESLHEALKQAEKETHATGRRLAEAMVDHGLKQIERNTPVQTYHLRRSYKKTPVEYVATSGLQVAMYAWTGVVFTEVEYAEYVDLGTGLWGPRRKKYKIEPKTPGGVLAFAPYERTPGGSVILTVEGQPSRTGRTVMVRFVMHPGSPGHHMFELGATLTEFEMDEWSRYPLELWHRHIERGDLQAAGFVHPS